MTRKYFGRGLLVLIVILFFAGYIKPDDVADEDYVPPPTAVYEEADHPAVPLSDTSPLRPPSNPWSNNAIAEDAGTCGTVNAGHGWSGSLVWPVDSHQLKNNRAFRVGHAAIDIEAPLDSPVYAGDTGEVVWAGWSRWGGGNVVVLAHGNTWQTHYAHLATVTVSCGQVVSAGAQIGTVGQTGASNFPHLHFELRFGGMAYDPIGWLP